VLRAATNAPGKLSGFTALIHVQSRIAEQSWIADEGRAANPAICISVHEQTAPAEGTTSVTKTVRAERMKLQGTSW
jgi:hypothetical protein